MFRYIVKRLLLLIPVLVGVSLFIFVSMNMAQGDFVDTLITEDMTDEDIQRLREAYGLDKHVLIRYGEYVLDLFQGEMGESYSLGEPVFDLFTSRIGATAFLAIASTIVTIIIAVPLGIVSATHRGSLLDNICNVFGVIGLATPNFWLGLLLIILFAVKLQWLPPYGNDGWFSVILPAITIGTGHTASLMRTTRSAMLDTLRSDYLRTARSKGVSEKTVVRKHAFKNALIPVLEISVSQFAACFGGAALTESVFTWPGVGKMVVDAVNSRDVPLACGFLILKCSIICIIGLVGDLLYVVVDPRVKTMYLAKRKKRKEAA